jgi:hypothetical protein
MLSFRDPGEACLCVAEDFVRFQIAIAGSSTIGSRAGSANLIERAMIVQFGTSRAI